MNPVKIKLLDKKNLLINWDDNREDVLNLKTLRKLCPCATCLAEREKQHNLYIPIFAENQINVQSINQVGNYAISISWQDGHNTGIYEYTFLRKLSENKNK
jgi:DUF971 family protein